MNLVVTGGAGMIGSRFIKLLPEEIKLIENIDRTNQLDILDLPGMKRALITKHQSPNTIIHFAAFTNVDAAAQQEGDLSGSCYRINVSGTQNIIELAREFEGHLIHISTDYVFDGSKSSPYTEGDSPNPIEWYGKTKFEAEQLVQSSDVNWCIVRTAYPFVASYREKLDLVRQRIQQMKKNSLPTQFTDHPITPTFVDELSNALVTLIRKKAKGIYHLVGSDSLTDFEISQTIAEVFGFKKINIQPSSIKEYNQTASRLYQESMAMSNQKFEKEFGPHFSKFRQALKTMKNQMNQS